MDQITETKNADELAIQRRAKAEKELARFTAIDVDLVSPYIDMGTCPDCTLDWRMSRSEFVWWKKKIPAGFSAPRRCVKCREIRRKDQKEFGQEVVKRRMALSEKLRKLAEDVRKGVYSDDHLGLALLLLAMSEEASHIPTHVEEFIKEKKCPPQSNGSGTGSRNATAST